MKFYISFLIIAFFAKHGISWEEHYLDQCPYGNVTPSILNAHCGQYSGLVMFEIYNAHIICCDPASLNRCTETGMRSAIYQRNTVVGPYYIGQFVYSDNREYSSYAYEVNTDREHKFLCPYPIGYLWYNMYAPKTKTTPPSAYLAIGHWSGHRRTCQANKDCGINEFCGDVINRSYDPRQRITPRDKLPNIEMKQHFCFNRPQLANGEKFEFVSQPLKRNYFFCENDNSCTKRPNIITTCYTNSLMWSEYIPNPDPEVLGERKQWPGICVEVKPLSSILSTRFESLGTNEQQGEEGKKCMPVGYEVGKHLKCSINSDCPEKQFCGNMFSLNDPANIDSLNTFCYAVPEIPAPYNLNTKYIIIPKLLNLVPCNVHQDCVTGGALGSSFCLIGTVQYAGKDGSTRKLFKGLCAEAKICDANSDHVWELGGAPASLDSCDNDSDCDGGGLTKIGDYAQESFQSYCVKNRTAFGMNLCCYGKVCPDQQTPFLYEPKCSGYDESNPKSGECPATGAMCRFGHCCPKAEFDGNGKFHKPKYSYLTNQRCQAGIRPLQFPAGYCEPETGRVMIIGNLSTNGIRLTPTVDSEQCQTDADCSIDYSALCIYEDVTPNSIAHCYHNPETYKPPIHYTDTTFLIIIIVVVLAFIVIVLTAFIGGFVFYKLKSNFKEIVTKRRRIGKKNEKLSKTPTTPTTSKSTTNTGTTGSGVSSGGSPWVI